MMLWRKKFISMVYVSYLLLLFVCLSYSTILHKDYCVVGAGPAGLQMGYFFKKAHRDYIIFERSNITGSFFTTYPRHRKLISINKRHTGKTNQEFNLRHDWNSLLSDDKSLLFRHYSKLMFPHADSLLEYLKDFQKKLNISVQFNTNIENIRKVFDSAASSSGVFHMNDQNGNEYSCGTLIVATGMWKPNIPLMEGIEFAHGYETVSINPEDYEGKAVLILGRGNSAFEIADGIYGSTNFVHLLGRSRVRLSWATHYVGDLRAVNNAVLDTYQLKSLDGIIEAVINYGKLYKQNGKIYITSPEVSLFDNFALRDPYDIVIRCLGFKFDKDIFSNTTKLSFGKGRVSKFPAIKHTYESVDVPGLFYAGAISHSLDFRKSAGGFIHGYRYTVQVLHRILEWRNHRLPWPSTTLPFSNLIATIFKRINEASGLYQMFEVLGDVFLFKNGSTEFEHIQEFPIKILHQLKEITGRDGDSIIVLVMQYGANFSGPEKDVFRINRATGEPSRAFQSNFLHPVFYYYKNNIEEIDILNKGKHHILPLPNQLHHILEDFLTQWNAPFSHILPFRRFLENSLGMDLRNFFDYSCMEFWMIYSTVPITCEQHFLQGQALTRMHPRNKYTASI